MKTYNLTILYITVLCLSLSSCSQQAQNNRSQTEPVHVFAAASLTDVLSEMIDSFELSTSWTIRLNLGSSGTLARQIEQGAAADICISASRQWAEYLANHGYFEEGYRCETAHNQLVLIAPRDGHNVEKVALSEIDLPALLGTGYLSIGDPSHVPAGKYGKQSLMYFNWFTNVESQFLMAKDVRSALMVVELGEAPLGIVYKSDAVKSKRVSILGTFPESSHDPVVYTTGLCNKNEATLEFYRFITSENVQEIWKKHGFSN